MASPTTHAVGGFLVMTLLLLAHTTAPVAAQRRKKAVASPPPPSPVDTPTPTPSTTGGGRRKNKFSPPPAGGSGSGPSTPLPPNFQPNFVLLMVDDQDYLLDSTNRKYMPKLHQYIGDEGLHLNNFVVTTSICCPARTSLLTGQYSHNHNVTSNQAPQGSFDKFEELGIDRRKEGWLPTWLQKQGYDTYFTGKFINHFDVTAGQTSRCPMGFTMFDPLTDKTVYDYFNYEFMPQCAKYDTYTNEYQTDVMLDRSVGYLEAAAAKGKPFYLQINPAACHTACPKGEEEGTCINPVPAPRHKGTYEGKVKVPRSPNWGVFLPTKLDLTPDEDLAAKGIDRHYAARLETMLAVDEMIESIVKKLEDLNLLQTTYFIYVSDNGYHLGNHGLAKGKHMPYEEDIRVPLYIRGPGIAPGSISDYMASMVDLTTTFVTMAGGAIPDIVDGLPLPLDKIAAGDPSVGAGRYPNFPKTTAPLRDSVPIELWANAFDKRIDKKDYRSVRVCANYDLVTGATNQKRCYKYIVWCVWPDVVNYRELFDLTNDIYEIKNLYPFVFNNTNAKRLMDRLNALTQAHGYCKGKTCRTPWSVIHTDGSVANLDQALDRRYDTQYAQYTTFTWRSCARYYDPVNNEYGDKRLGALSRLGNPPVVSSTADRGNYAPSVSTRSAWLDDGVDALPALKLSADGKGHNSGLDEERHEHRRLLS